MRKLLFILAGSVLPLLGFVLFLLAPVATVHWLKDPPGAKIPENLQKFLDTTEPATQRISALVREREKERWLLELKREDATSEAEIEELRKQEQTLEENYGFKLKELYREFRASVPD